MGEIVFHALLLADKIIEERNRKKGLIGVFSRFHFPWFPANSPPFYIYISVSNIKGRHTFSLNMTFDEAQIVVLPIGGEFESKEPSAEIEMVFPVKGVNFPKDGIYSLTFNIDGQQIASKNITVELKKPK